MSPCMNQYLFRPNVKNKGPLSPTHEGDSNVKYPQEKSQNKESNPSLPSPTHVPLPKNSKDEASVKM